MAIGLFEVVKAEGTTNLVTNPSFEVDTNGVTNGTDWTLTQSATQQFRGVYSLSATGGASPNDEPIVYSASNIGNGTDYAFSFWVYVDTWASGADITADIKITGITNETVVSSWVSGTDDTGAWRRVVTTFTGGATASGSIVVKLSASGSTGDVFYIDALQLEEKSGYPTTYCDGDQLGCRWLAGTKHTSAKSTRDFFSKAGGRVFNLRDDKTYSVSNPQGAGMHPVSNVTVDYAILGGSQYRRTVPLDGFIAIPATVYASTLNGLHQIREGVRALFDASATEPQQKTMLRYTGVTNYVQIPTLYDGGFEITAIVGFSESDLPLMLQRDPYWQELAEQGVELDVVATLTVASVAHLDSLTGLWDNANTTSTVGSVLTFDSDVDNTIIVGGAYTAIGGVSHNRITRYDGVSYDDIPSGGTGANNVVNVVRLAPDGKIFAGGAFTTMNGVTVNGVTFFDGTNWNAMGATGVSGGNVNGIAFDDDNNAYVVGDFTSAGGVANTSHVAKWDGSAWSSISSGITGGGTIVLDDCVVVNGVLYVGGDFDTIDGVTVSDFAKYDIATDTWSAPASVGPSDRVRVLSVAPDNTVYLGGNFTTVGTDTYNRIARFDGANFSTLGTGTNGNVFAIAVNSAGDVYAGGGGTEWGGLTVTDRAALYRNGNWQALDIDLPSTNSVFATFVGPNEDVYLGFNDTGTATTSGAVTSIFNRGTAPCFPIITLSNPSGGTADNVVKITNFITRQSIWFDGLVIQPRETITIDLRQGIKSMVSSTRGDILSFIRRGGQQTLFRLLAGNNDLAVFINNSSTSVTATAYWKVSHASIDGGSGG